MPIDWCSQYALHIFETYFHRNPTVFQVNIAINGSRCLSILLNFDAINEIAFDFFAVPLNVSYAALESLLQFVYYGEVNVNEDDLAAFLSSAETLQIKGLSDSGYRYEQQPSNDLATPTCQLDANYNECFVGHQTQTNDKQSIVSARPNKRSAGEQSVAVAPKRTKVHDSMDADKRQHKTASATVVSDWVGELDGLVLPTETLSFDCYEQTVDNVEVSFVDMFDEAGYMPDEGEHICLSTDNLTNNINDRLQYYFIQCRCCPANIR